MEELSTLIFSDFRRIYAKLGKKQRRFELRNECAEELRGSINGFFKDVIVVDSYTCIVIPPARIPYVLGHLMAKNLNEEYEAFLKEVFDYCKY